MAHSLSTSAGSNSQHCAIWYVAAQPASVALKDLLDILKCILLQRALHGDEELACSS